MVNLAFEQPAVAALDLPSYQQLSNTDSNTDSMLPREMFIYDLIKYNAKLTLMHLTWHFEFATATFHLLIKYSTVMCVFEIQCTPCTNCQFHLIEDKRNLSALRWGWTWFARSWAKYWYKYQPNIKKSFSSAVGVNMVCGSGLRAVALAAQVSQDTLILTHVDQDWREG